MQGEGTAQGRGSFSHRDFSGLRGLRGTAMAAQPPPADPSGRSCLAVSTWVSGGRSLRFRQLTLQDSFLNAFALSSKLLQWPADIHVRHFISKCDGQSLGCLGARLRCSPEYIVPLVQKGYRQGRWTSFVTQPGNRPTFSRCVALWNFLIGIRVEDVIAAASQSGAVQTVRFRNNEAPEAGGRVSMLTRISFSSNKCNSGHFPT
jgi:hypothetical protein